jgi:aryl-alcohol dehydrogenase-like predicted oxidoreductase
MSIAGDLGCSVGQLAIAWCAKNPHVSTVILGATTSQQLSENLKALEVLPKLDATVMAEIEAAAKNPATGDL